MQLELSDAMRLEPVRAPDALHRADAHACLLGHRRAGPVRPFARWRLHGQGDDALGERSGELGDARGPRLIVQKSVHPFGDEALLPAPDAGLRLAGLSHDRVRPDPLGAEQHDLRPPHVLLRGVAVLDQSSEPIDIGGRDGKGNAGSHLQTRTPRVCPESPPGFKCQILSTSSRPAGHRFSNRH
jgi:hypothetical protein